MKRSINTNMKPIKTSTYLIATLLLVLAAGCGQKKSTPSGEGELKGTVSLSGAFALYPLANIWAEEFRKVHPGVRFNISAGGAGKGMADALGAAVDLGMFSREFTPQEIELGVWWVAVTKDAVLPTVNANHPEIALIKEKGLTREKFRKIFITQEIKTWGEALGNSGGEKIGLYTRSDAAGAAATWAQYLGAQGQEELKGIGVFGDPGLADAVRNDKHGIGFNNVIYVFDLKTGKKYPGIEVIPIDANENGTIDPEEQFYDDIHKIVAAIGDDRYPSPPARELYFVAKGKPESEVVRTFLEWVLTEGQNFIGEAGYIKLPETKIREELEKLTTDQVKL